MRRTDIEALGELAAAAGLNHFRLLDHPAVYAQLRTWLTRAGA